MTGVSITPWDRVPETLAHRAFMDGFADYFVRFDYDLERFRRRFFLEEANRPSTSFVAHSGEEPLGVVVGGIDTLRGMPTMRCGGMAVVPAARGTGVADTLMERHLEAGMAGGARSATLEALVQNERAHRFYERHGYRRVGGLEYWRREVGATQRREGLATGDRTSLRDTDVETFLRVWRGLELDLPRESDPSTIRRRAEAHVVIEAGPPGAPLGQLCGTVEGGLRGVWVQPAARGRGVGEELVRAYAARFEAHPITACLPSGHGLERFLRRVGLERLDLAQIVMVRPLAAA